MDSSDTSSILKPRLALFSLAFVGLSAAVPYVIYRQTSTGSAFTLDPRLISWPMLAGCAALLVAYFLTDGLRLRYALRAFGYSLTAKQVAELVFINLFVSNMTPMASGGGFAQIWYLRRRRIPVRAALAATTLRSALGLAAIFLATPIVAFALPQLPKTELTALPIVALAIVSLAGAVFVGLAVRRPRWLAIAVGSACDVPTRVFRLNGTRLRRLRRGLVRETLRFSRSLAAALKGRRKDLILTSVHTVLFLLALFSFPYLIMRSLDLQAPYWATVGLVTVSTFAMYFAPTPGGAGFAEGSFWLFFASVAPQRQLAFIVIAWRFLTIYFGMLIGLLVTLREFARGKEGR